MTPNCVYVGGGIIIQCGSCYCELMHVFNRTDKPDNMVNWQLYLVMNNVPDQFDFRFCQDVKLQQPTNSTRTSTGVFRQYLTTKKTYMTNRLIIFEKCIHAEHGMARPSTDGKLTFVHVILFPSVRPSVSETENAYTQL